jgi:hypothetical protein
MARFTKLVLTLVPTICFTVAAPSNSQAGMTPGIAPAVFGWVDNLYSGNGGTPTTIAYNYRVYGTSYAATPVTVAYAPVSAGCGCSQTVNYVPYTSYYGYSSAYYGGSSSCSSCCSSCCSGCCPSGCGAAGCSSGTCSGCTTGATSSTSGYPSPTPDPYANGKASPRELEERLRRLEHEHEQHQQFLKDKHSDFDIKPYRPSGSSTVPPRTNGVKSESFGSDKQFQTPRNRRPADDEPAEPQEANKPALGTPAPIDEDKNKTSNETNTEENKSSVPGPAPAKESDVEAKRMLNTLTARAVAPRQRLSSALSSAKPAPVVANNSIKKSTKTVLDSSLTGDIVRH